MCILLTIVERVSSSGVLRLCLHVCVREQGDNPEQNKNRTKPNKNKINVQRKSCDKRVCCFRFVTLNVLYFQQSKCLRNGDVQSTISLGNVTMLHTSLYAHDLVDSNSVEH